MEPQKLLILNGQQVHSMWPSEILTARQEMGPGIQGRRFRGNNV